MNENWCKSNVIVIVNDTLEIRKRDLCNLGRVDLRHLPNDVGVDSCYFIDAMPRFILSRTTELK